MSKQFYSKQFSLASVHSLVLFDPKKQTVRANNFDFLVGANGIMVIVIKNRHADMGSNPALS